MSAKRLITTLGAKRAEEVGMILPHEHVFVDLRTWDQPGYAQADTVDVIRLMATELHKAREAGVSCIVECSPVGVGRRADILQAVSEAAVFPLVVPTGIYRDAWIPPWARQMSEAELADWMLEELEEDIEGSGVQAGFIKLGASDGGLTYDEEKILRAAAEAAKQTGAAIGSHTVSGRVAQEQACILENAGLALDRFIWIHAAAEAEVNINLELARRGVWIEYDFLGTPQTDAGALERIRRLAEAGLLAKVLISHDRGWYDPAQPGGGTPQPYTHISYHFLPRLREEGFSAGEIEQITRHNPFEAFAR